MRRLRLLLALTAVLALALAGCGTDDPAASDPTGGAADGDAGGSPAVVATTSIIGDMVTQVVGDAAAVEVLMGPGVDPHAFSPSAAQAQALREADLVVANGLQLEANLLDVIEAAEQDGVAVVELGPEVDPIAYTDDDDHDHEHESESDDHDDHDDHEHESDDHDHGDDESESEHDDHDHESESDHAHESEHDDHDDDDASEAEHDDQESQEHEDDDHDDHDDHDHGEFDPHVWLDADRMADAVGVITDALAEVDTTLDADEWSAMGEAYATELRALDDELQETLAAIPDARRQLVTNHDSFAYWADAYDFEVVGTVIPGDTTQLDTSAAEFAQLVETIQDTGVTAIFSETTSSDRLAEAVADEVGRDIEIVRLYSGALDAPDADAGTYVGLMRTNAQLMVDALAN